MKNKTLAIIFSLVISLTHPSIASDISNSALSNLDALQLLPVDEVSLDPSLFDSDTFAQIALLTFFNNITDEYLQKIPAEAFGGLTIEQFIELPADVFDSFSPLQFSHLLPDILTGMDRERFGFLTPDVIGALTREQVNNIPRAAIDGMTEAQFDSARLGEFLSGLIADNMGGLPPEVIDKFDSSDFAQLDKAQCRQMPSHDLAKLLTNLNPNNFIPDDIKECLPSDWLLDESDGTLTPPANTRIFLDILTKPANLPVELDLPDIFNLRSGFGVAGLSGNGSILDGLNKIIEKLGLADQFVFDQQTDIGGILKLKSLGESERLEFAFIPDLRRVQYVGPEDSASIAGITQDQQNSAFILTSALGMSLPLLPAPNNPVKILEALASQGTVGEVQLGDNGVVIISDLPDMPYPLAFMCDMFVSTDPGVGQGLHINPLGDAINWLVDANGNAQKVNPTLPEPKEMVNLGQLFDVDIQHQTDGSFTVLFANMDKYILKPTFEVEACPLADGEQVTPGFGTNSKGKFSFITVKDKIMMVIRLIVIDPDGNTLDL